MSDKKFKEAATSVQSTPAVSDDQVVRSRAMSPFGELDRMFDSLFARDWMLPHRWERLTGLKSTMPRVDILDKDAEVILRAEIPGIEPQDVDVSVTDRTVTIKGESHRESRKEEGDYYRCEISQGSVMRTVDLPCDIDADKAEATFKNGILEVTLPKLKEAHRRKLHIKA
ncbi:MULTISPECIES: Hsp20/alpha crystallin family protein [Chromohalobacter]|uniref:Heat shock protein Hsp20 n=1 Tax=Chromohalobacter israelensis (strain ATCC BAA-138 / DSM 3043 / CIP 106854 / NCIMB 13768 / 1H11) TaxID=290398 RepID=Q1QXM5_CHRI1|nr:MULTISPECIES: Hsp20/alpha crystallin family protein [Chromohalobacter]ABE58783.1 heat shock protein Hsp20 [Chromohalobacter salexigens DSM 3043]MBZ5877076.1 Hsp20/alpha crystallin family protein [Chromohalobacter salexigens]MDO0944855.1 Hsp20/alpha crystallin family protein [Chromohalobacter salexigens]PWW33260.1 heat shock protein Hsp20 [Chromohalobacter salexigens]